MKTLEYQKMADLEDSYWWHIGRKSIISQQLKLLKLSPSTKILNIGCGTGGMIPLFEQYGKVTNVDVSPEAIEYCKRHGYKVDKYNGKRLPYKNSQFDLIVATDVLEHIKEDGDALKEWKRVLKKGGHILITVPAYQWLWSDHDQSLHHYRRYTASELHRKINYQDMHVIKRTYAIIFSFPLIVGYRLFSSVFTSKEKDSSYVMLPRPINSVFTNLLRLEAHMQKHINFPFGTSILLIAKKP